VRVRRSRHLISYWEDEQLVVHNYATSRILAVPARTAELLDFFGTWRSIDELVAWQSLSARDARALIDRLVDLTLLQRSDRRTSAEEAAMAAWEPWNPAAGFFHDATRNVKFVDLLDGSRVPDQKARVSRPPRPTKRYRGATVRALPPVSGHGELPQVLLARRTWRQFAKRAIALDDLGTLLGLTSGVQHWALVPGEGELPLKTSPSGGALHPIETYVCARRVEGIEPGLYHYASDAHCLELVKAQPRRVRVQRYLPTQYWYEGAAALIFFTGVFERCLWKYTYARMYRAVLIEAGHQCQTFCLVATWLGLAPFCSMALADSSIEKDLGLDGISESVLYAAGLGARPAGEAVLSHPAGLRPMTRRPNPHLKIAPVRQGSRKQGSRMP
jgi:SagB-type dehydrogenase family enzyme